MSEPAAWRMSEPAAGKTPLRRSFSEHVKVSTNKAWDVFWRSVRERRLWEIEAKEACDWLRAAGFPQYVQLFKDCRFPIDTEWVKRDHHFLDKDALDSVCRRLNTLNKCVEMRLDSRRSKHRGDDRSEEDFCAISPSWTYDHRARRWRRRDSTADPQRPTSPQDDCHDVCSIHSSSSSESAATGASPTAAADEQGTSRSSSRCSSTNKTLSLDMSLSGPPSPGGGSSSTASLEADGCGADKPPRKKGTSLLRKMEKLRLRGTTGFLGGGGEHGGGRAHGVTGRAAAVQEGPMGEGRMERLHGPSSRASSSPSSPHTISSSSSNSQSASSSAVSTPSPVTRVRSNCKRSNSSGSQGGEDYRNQINNNNNLVFQIPHGHKPGTFPTSLAHKHASLPPGVDANSVNWRTGSFHGYRGRHSCLRGASSLLPGGGERDAGGPSPPDATAATTPDHRLSVYDNVTEVQQLSESEGDGSDRVRVAEEAAATRMLENEDVFSALDSILESINDLQQLVSSWSENLSEDDCHGDSSSSSSSASSSTSTSSSTSSSSPSHDSPAHGSSAASPCPSSPSHIHLEVQPHEEMEEEEEEVESGEKLPVNGEEAQTTSPQARSSRASQQPHWSSEQSLPSLPSSPGVENLSASQFLLLQKLSLLKLTALMDKHSPSSKQGWSWTVPKSPRKTKVTEVKGQRVFGVPLLLNAQQSGEPLPPSILQALDYLRTECLEQVGLFRKSGLKSRIQYLREMVESEPDAISYEGQSAFDVADMVKQYFRDLPEPIFTCRLCESFLHIYQYFPKDQQLAAAQAAILLLPDENREALRTLLFFLHEVVACVEENQMTPTNVAVCLAPSLFHLNTLQRDANAARSGHRKYSLGRPDQRDLSENLAATQGLANMITEAQRLFQLPEFWPAQTLSPAEESGGEEEDEERGRSQLQLSTQLLLKEAREKNHGWEEQAAPEPVDLAFKKMDDGCPLWLWRGSVEVEAPQAELLRRLLWEAELWQRGLQQPAVLQTLSKDAHIYRCLLQGRGGGGHGPAAQPPRQHLLLRTWQPDPSAGALYLSSVSTEHPEAPADGVRAHVHACLYLLEPTAAAGRTRLTHLCRTDTRGRSPQWHSKVGGALLASDLLAIKDSFRAEHKDTKI